jgi:serine/threonine protein kinase
MSAAHVQEVSDRGHLSKAADIYSFGVLLWEMYHGMPPYVFCSVKKKLVNNRSFPRFDLRPREEAPFSFVVLALACLCKEYDKRCVCYAGCVCLCGGAIAPKYLGSLVYLSELENKWYCFVGCVLT